MAGIDCNGGELTDPQKTACPDDLSLSLTQIPGERERDGVRVGGRDLHLDPATCGKRFNDRLNGTDFFCQSSCQNYSAST